MNINYSDFWPEDHFSFYCSRLSVKSGILKQLESAMSRFKSLPHYLPAGWTWASHSLRGSLHLINVDNQLIELWQLNKTSSAQYLAQSKSPPSGYWMLVVILLTCLPFQLSELILEFLVFLIGPSSCASRLLLSVHSSCFLSSCLSSSFCRCFGSHYLAPWFCCCVSGSGWWVLMLAQVRAPPQSGPPIVNLLTLAKSFKVLYTLLLLYSMCLSDQNIMVQTHKCHKRMEI